MAETLPIPCPRRQGADERHCSDNAVTLREPRSVSLRPGSPRLSVDPTSGHRAQLSMRTSLLIGLALRSEEHTSELQSRLHLVCRLLLEKKKQQAKQLIRAHA